MSAPQRRWRRGPGPIEAPGAALPALPAAQAAAGRSLLLALLARAPGAVMRWSSLGAHAKGLRDGVEAEHVVRRLMEAGLVEVHERRDRAGRWTPYEIRLTTAAAEIVDRWADRSADGGGDADLGELLVTTLKALIEDGEELPIPGRSLVQRALGDTKATRVEDHRAVLEAAFDCALEELVASHIDWTLTAGPLRYGFRGHQVDAACSAPWLALTEVVLAEMADLAIDAGVDEVLTVENLTAFEALCARGHDRHRVLVYTRGFLGRAAKTWLLKLVSLPAIRSVGHSGDLDPGGLLILRRVRDVVRRVRPDLDVAPESMHPEALARPDTRPLTEHDRRRLNLYLDDPDAPARDLATAMLAADRKLEQEALLIAPPSPAAHGGCPPSEPR